LAPSAYAQQRETPPAPAPAEPGEFLIWFDTNQSTLTPEGLRVVAQAAEAYRQRGAARITVTGHTDTVGSAAYNLRLSESRADTVANELIREGVPATDIITIGRGEEDLLVPTADGVNEPRNRRVEIAVPQAPPAPVAEAVPEVEPAAPPEKPGPFGFTIGPMVRAQFRREQQWWRE